MGKKARKAKKAWWKRQGPELERIATHIGKFIDKLDPKTVPDLLAAALCAYGGYHAGEVINANLAGKLGMAGTSVLAYQLAKSRNLIAGGSGVAYLSSMGIINVWNPLTETLLNLSITIGGELGKVGEQAWQWITTPPSLPKGPILQPGQQPSQLVPQLPSWLRWLLGQP